VRLYTWFLSVIVHFCCIVNSISVSVPFPKLTPTSTYASIALQYSAVSLHICCTKYPYYTDNHSWLLPFTKWRSCVLCYKYWHLQVFGSFFVHTDISWFAGVVKYLHQMYVVPVISATYWCICAVCLCSINVWRYCWDSVTAWLFLLIYVLFSCCSIVRCIKHRSCFWNVSCCLCCCVVLVIIKQLSTADADYVCCILRKYSTFFCRYSWHIYSGKWLVLSCCCCVSVYKYHGIPICVAYWTVVKNVYIVYYCLVVCCCLSHRPCRFPKVTYHQSLSVKHILIHRESKKQPNSWP